MIRILLLGFLLFPTIAEAANRFLTCTVTCTITAADTSIWGTTTGGTGASVPGSSDAVILDGATCVGGVTCTATMGAAYNPTWQSITMGTCTASTTGCILDFSANNNNITLSATPGLSITGTGTRNIKCGSGTWTFTMATGGVFDATTITNLTQTLNTCPLVLSATATGTRTINAGGLTYNSLTVSNAASNNRPVTLAQAGTYSSITFTNVGYVILGAAVTQTISGALSFDGLANQISVITTSTGATGTISVGSASALTRLAIGGVTKAGAGSITATDSYDIGNNSGVTIIAPASGGGRCIGC